MKFQSIWAAFSGGLVAFCLVISVAMAQIPTVWNNCPERGISTNPKKPVNPIDPTQVNTFNWLREEFSFNGITLPQSIPSPFFQRNNNLVEPLRATQDQQHSEGWEFITKGFGYMPSGAPAAQAESFPYYILYNKYTAIMRVFFAAESERLQGNFNAAQLSVSFAGSSYQSSVLMLADEPHAIFEKFIRSQSMVSVTAFNNYTRSWVYADFPMTYDPCACNFRSRLNVELKLVQTANIQMVGLSQGSLANIANGSGSVSQESSKWTLQNAINSGKKASETYNSIGDFTNKQLNELKNHDKVSKTQLPDSVITDKTKSLSWFQNVMRSSEFLKEGLKIAPYVGAAVSFLDTFFGGGKTASPIQQVQMMPMAINMTTTYTGSISTAFTKREVTIDNPGTKDAGLPPFNTEDYPAYNETMGNISVLTLPKIKMKTHKVNYLFNGFAGLGLTNVTYARTFSLSNLLINDLKIAVNPASGLDANNMDIKAALVFEFDNVNTPLVRPISTNLELEAKTPSTIRYRTPYINAYCLSEFLTSTVFRAGDSLVADNTRLYIVGQTITTYQTPKVYLKLIANLKRLDATPTTQNILYVQTFKLQTIEEVLSASTLNVNVPCSTCQFPLPIPQVYVMPYSKYPENITFRSGSTVNLSQANLPTRYAWGSVIVEPNVTFVGNQPLTIWAPGGVVYEDGAAPLPANITVITDIYSNNMDCLDEKYPPASLSFIQSACATTYKNQSQRWSKAEKDPVETASVGDNTQQAMTTTPITAYPNPAQNEVSIKYQVVEKGTVKLLLTNAMGVVVRTIVEENTHETGEFSVSTNISDLPNGVYLYTLHTANGVSTGKLVITK